MPNTKLTQSGVELQSAVNKAEKLPVTSSADENKVLKVDSSGNIIAGTDSTGMTNPMTTQGDLIVGGANGTPTRLAKGTAGQVLKVNENATGIEWISESGYKVKTLTASGTILNLFKKIVDICYSSPLRDNKIIKAQLNLNDFPSGIITNGIDIKLSPFNASNFQTSVRALRKNNSFTIVSYDLSTQTNPTSKHESLLISFKLNSDVDYTEFIVYDYGIIREYNLNDDEWELILEDSFTHIRDTLLYVGNTEIQLASIDNYSIPQSLSELQGTYTITYIDDDVAV